MPHYNSYNTSQEYGFHSLNNSLQCTPIRGGSHGAHEEFKIFLLNMAIANAICPDTITNMPRY